MGTSPSSYIQVPPGEESPENTRNPTVKWTKSNNTVLSENNMRTNLYLKDYSHPKVKSRRREEECPCKASLVG